MTGECFLCGNYETVERHHLFGGPFRKKADRLKLTVMLCPWCHQIDPDSAHKSAETRLYLHKYGQQKAMREQGWSVEDFVREFGKNYLDEDEIEDLRAAEEKRAAAAGGGERQHGFSEAAPLAGPGEAGPGMANAARWTVGPYAGAGFRVTEGAELPW